MITVLPFKAAPASPSYWRAPIGWIKRRARRIERFYGISRRLAVYDARLDYLEFTRMRDAQIIALSRVVEQTQEPPHGR